MIRNLRIKLGIILLSAAHYGILSAAGMWLYEVGTSTSGMASAGRAALATDASTSFENPAGMTRIPKNQVMGGIPLLFNTTQFQTSTTTNTGGNGDNAARFTPLVSLYYTQNLLPDYLHGVKIGFNANSYLNQNLRYSSDWAGRFYSRKTSLRTYKTSTVLAYEIFKGVSIGGGYITMYGRLKQTTAVNNSPNGLSDGEATTDQSDLSIGGTGGILFELSDNFRIGVTYKSPIHLEYRNPVTFNNLGPTVTAGLVSSKLLGSSVDLDIHTPQEFVAGIYSSITSNLAVVLDAAWQGWKKFDHVQPTVTSDTPTSLTKQRELKNAWHAAIGFQFDATKDILLMTGFSYDSSPIDKANRTPDFPVDRQFRYGAGIQVRPLPSTLPSVMIGANYEFADLGSAPIDQNTGPLTGTLVGKYEKNRLSAISIYGSWSY